jgi:uncharacterized protein (TIGR02996 family)
VSHISDDGAALLRAIRENPDEDTPRLVYADWLDEQGGESNEARSELIRLQIAEAAKLPPNTFEAVGQRYMGDMTAAEIDLIHRFGDADPAPQGWRLDLPTHAGVFYGNKNLPDRFARGFLWRARFDDVPAFLAVAPKLFDAAPITCVEFNKLTPGSVRKLAASPYLRHVRQWSDRVAKRTDEMLVALAASEHLVNLREIFWNGPAVGTKTTGVGVRALVTAPAIRTLTRMQFDLCAIGDIGLEAIATSPKCAGLEFLHLNGNHRCCGVAGIAALAAAPLRLTLRALDLGSTDLTDDAVAPLVKAEWPGLIRLNLSGNEFTDRTGAALLKSDFWLRSGCELNLIDGFRLSKKMNARLKAAFGDRIKV